MDGAEREQRASEAKSEMAAETVACPYCAEEIKPTARVCKHCGRDFFLVQPLLDQVRTLAKRVEELEDSMVRLVEDTKHQVTAIAVRTRAQPSVRQLPGWSEKVPAISRKTAVCISLVWVLTVDYLINFTFNLSFGLIQVAIIFGPLVCGFLCRKETPNPLAADFTAGLMLALVSVIAMNYLTMRYAQGQGMVTSFWAKEGAVSFWPAEAVDWIQNAHLFIATALAFMGGAFARRLFVGFPRHMPVQHDFTWDVSNYVVRWKLGGKLKPADVEGKIKSVESLLTSLLTIGTTAVAIFAALGKIFN